MVAVSSSSCFCGNVVSSRKLDGMSGARDGNEPPNVTHRLTAPTGRSGLVITGQLCKAQHQGRPAAIAHCLYGAQQTAATDLWLHHCTCIVFFLAGSCRCVLHESCDDTKRDLMSDIVNA